MLARVLADSGLTVFSVVVAGIAALMAGGSGLAALVNARRESVREKRGSSVEAIRVTQEAMADALERLQKELDRRDRAHLVEVKRLNRKMDDVSRHHAECEAERTSLVRRVVELEARLTG